MCTSSHVTFVEASAVQIVLTSNKHYWNDNRHETTTAEACTHDSLLLQGATSRSASQTDKRCFRALFHIFRPFHHLKLAAIRLVFRWRWSLASDRHTQWTFFWMCTVCASRQRQICTGKEEQERKPCKV